MDVVNGEGGGREGGFGGGEIRGGVGLMAKIVGRHSTQKFKFVKVEWDPGSVKATRPPLCIRPIRPACKQRQVHAGDGCVHYPTRFSPRSIWMKPDSVDAPRSHLCIRALIILRNEKRMSYCMVHDNTVRCEIAPLQCC